MKKYLSEFVKRGLMAAAGGPLVLATIYGILGATGAVESLAPGEVCRGILSVSLMAFICAGVSMIYTVEELPLAVAILIHAGVLYLDYLLVYLLNQWLPRNGIGIFSLIFFASYGIIWAVIYLCVRSSTQKLNAKMQEQ